MNCAHGLVCIESVVLLKKKKTKIKGKFKKAVSFVILLTSPFKFSEGVKLRKDKSEIA